MVLVIGTENKQADVIKLEEKTGEVHVLINGEIRAIFQDDGDFYFYGKADNVVWKGKWNK